MNEAYSVLDDKKEPGDEDEFIGAADFFDPIAALLSSIGGEAENLTEELRKYGIKYEHLSALCDEDLSLLGMKNKKVREEVLVEISSLPNQMEHYDGELKTLNTGEYVGDVLANISSQLDNLKALLVLTQVKIHTHHVNNVQIDDTKYASEVLVNVCEKLTRGTIELQNSMETLLEGRSPQNETKAIQRVSAAPSKCPMKFLLMGSVLLSSAYLGFKYFRVKPFLM
ncbi:hypothetical protein pipiens_015142 [Culex pipiens pipiens]|uniref:SAM domain-containing protein n=1 Tax=Culex pipiens pipiens TaxID=38569 RepID=A0ABD1CRT4_CULPP|nr:uncharacterized protein LOC120425487 [Culex pipiens pallens]